jgi:cysteine-rich repeat protein
MPIYELDVDPGETAAIEVEPTGFDAVLARIGDCSALDCPGVSDAPGMVPELLTYTNSGASTETVTVAVYPFGLGGSGGAFTLRAAVATCGDGVVAPGEACDDGDTLSGDGCSSGCTPELGYSCMGSPSVCTRVYTVAPIAAACVPMGTGTDVPALGDDEASPITALPFAFSFFGTAVTHYSVTSNGFVQLWTSATGAPSTTYINAAIADTAPPNGMIAPFWDDLNVVAGTSTLRSRIVGTAPNRRFVIEWGSFIPFGVPGDSLRFQAWLREGSSQIELHYCSLTGSARSTGESATIGLESLDGTSGVPVSFNTASAVTTGSGYRFTP